MNYKFDQNLSKNNNLKIKNNSSKVNYNKILFSILSIIFILLIIYILVCYYNYNNETCYEKKNFLTYMFDFTSSDVCSIKYKPNVIPPPTIKKNVNSINNLIGNEEVYHISNQDYTFDQSKCKCASYGGRLATKNEITEAYNKGANWCSYGWTQGQNAFFPVQKCFYDELEEESEDYLENSDIYCGKPGLNGGYFANPELKFGVNCYGKKPKGSVIKPKDPECDKSKDFCSLSKNFQASNKLESDEIVSFNEDKWNMN